MLMFSTHVLVMLPSALSTWSLLCDGRHTLVVVILFQFPACLRVHSVEGVNEELVLLASSCSNEEIFRKEFLCQEEASFSRDGSDFGYLKVHPRLSPS
jgi:hypothetical protein